MMLQIYGDRALAMAMAIQVCLSDHDIDISQPNPREYNQFIRGLSSSSHFPHAPQEFFTFLFR